MNIATHKHLKLLGLILFVPLVLALLSLLVGSLVTLGGLSLMRVAEWQAWQIHHYWYFLSARIVCFSLAAWGWVGLRRRTLRVQPAFLPRLKKAEVTAVFGILLIELMRVLALWEELV
ncbi:hypothetical protein NLK61_25460 [Pseudomonas fuscovaginae UPB0736]|uniref:Uncharacterized protein n=1 Tax=Pseudomonas asplenii TaxID=53407 RepID=A0A1H6NXL1_9PSED|nr:MULTISPECIES: hypothetical protein [Pseudomonas]UUQ64516.1 hypothetical protein NLK61_25460 [Pseudomonas fuscovaginae UPB0736]SDT07855.1 hypothetical protein SAMN05216598_3881 [Pseudomonas asplenii]SEI21745.1 hypothetical protein SAMN05216581_4609 [Pseudomonas fuscovaginae]